MAVTPMDAAVDAQEREANGEPLMIPFPAILDEKGEPIRLPIRELTDGQGIALMNIQSRTTRPYIKPEEKVEELAPVTPVPVAPPVTPAPKAPAVPSADEDRVGDLIDGLTPPPEQPPY